MLTIDYLQDSSNSHFHAPQCQHRRLGRRRWQNAGGAKSCQMPTCELPRPHPSFQSRIKSSRRCSNSFFAVTEATSPRTPVNTGGAAAARPRMVRKNVCLGASHRNVCAKRPQIPAAAGPAMAKRCQIAGSHGSSSLSSQICGRRLGNHLRRDGLIGRAARMALMSPRMALCVSRMLDFQTLCMRPDPDDRSDQPTDFTILNRTEQFRRERSQTAAFPMREPIHLNASPMAADRNSCARLIAASYSAREG